MSPVGKTNERLGNKCYEVRIKFKHLSAKQSWFLNAYLRQDVEKLKALSKLIYSFLKLH